MDVSIVIPVFNESENVEALFNALSAYLDKCNFSAECIFVDDGSSDDTYVKMQNHNNEKLKGKLIKLSKNYGSHAAIRAGIKNATGKYTMFFSADLQEPVELIGSLYNKISEGYDVVYVQKGQTDISKGEKIFSKIYAKSISKFAVPNFPLGGVNNMLFNEKIRNVVNEHIEPNSSIILQIINLGFNSCTVTCNYEKRNAGKSKWTLGKKIKLFIDSFVSFSYMPIRFVTGIGMLLAFAGIIWAICVLIIKIFNIYPLATGWATLIAILLIGFGITNISIGIIAEYVWRTMDLAKKQPVFIIDEIKELKHKESIVD